MHQYRELTFLPNYKKCVELMHMEKITYLGFIFSP